MECYFASYPSEKEYIQSKTANGYHNKRSMRYNNATAEEYRSGGGSQWVPIINVRPLDLTMEIKTKLYTWKLCGSDFAKTARLVSSVRGYESSTTISTVSITDINRQIYTTVILEMLDRMDRSSTAHGEEG